MWFGGCGTGFMHSVKGWLFGVWVIGGMCGGTGFRHSCSGRGFGFLVMCGFREGIVEGRGRWRVRWKGDI